MSAVSAPCVGPNLNERLNGPSCTAFVTHSVHEHVYDRASATRTHTLKDRRAGFFSWGCLLGILSLAAAGCGSHSAQPRPTPSPAPAPVPDVREGRETRLQVQTEDGRIVQLSLEEYVRGTVGAEMWLPGNEDPAVAERIFEVQALVARTYAVANLRRHAADGFDLCSTTHCQLYRQLGKTERAARWAEAIDEAVSRTRGAVILFDDEPILALFHANCGGATSAAEGIWGGTARPYLTSVKDEMCERAPTWRVTVQRDALTHALDTDPRTTVRGRLDSIDVVQTDPAGRALLVALTGARSPVVRGEELRLILSRTFGPQSLKSPRFSVHREGNAFTFQGKGSGHGAGLCQAGTIARLRAGATPAEVLSHYYPGTRIGPWRAPRHT